MLLRPEHRRCLKHPVIDPHHGLLVKLGALPQLRLLAEIVQLEHIGSALRPPRHDLGGVDLCKSLAEQILPKAPDDALLNLEFRPLADIAQGNGPQGQLCLQGGV